MVIDEVRINLQGINISKVTKTSDLDVCAVAHIFVSMVIKAVTIEQGFV